MKHYTHYFIKMRILNFCLLFLAGLILNSCGTGSVGTAIHIPKEASIVIAINMKNITTKEKDWQEIINKEVIGQMGTTDEKVGKALERIFNAGVNYESTAYLFTKTGKELKDNYAVFSFLLADESKFETVVKEEIAENSTGTNKPELKTEGNLKYVTNQDKTKSILVWGDKQAMIIVLEAEKDVKDILSLVQTIRSTKKEESLLETNPQLKELTSQTNDITFWFNQEEINKFSTSRGFLEGGIPMGKAISEINKISVITANFEKGQILVNAKNYLDTEKSKKYEGLFKVGLDSKSLDNLSINMPLLFLGVNIEIEKLYQILEEEKGLETPKENSERLKIPLEELKKMLTGSFNLAIGDLMVSKLMGGEFDSEAVLSIGIANKATLKRVLDKLVELKDLEKKGDHYINKLDAKSNLYVIEKDNEVYITLNEGVKNKIIKGGSGIDAMYKEMGKESFFVNYINLAGLFKQIPSAFIDGNEGFENARDNVFTSLESITFEGFAMKESMLEVKFIVGFKDKEANAMKSLVEIAKKTKEAKQAKDKKSKEAS